MTSNELDGKHIADKYECRWVRRLFIKGSNVHAVTPPRYQNVIIIGYWNEYPRNFLPPYFIYSQ